MKKGVIVIIIISLVVITFLPWILSVDVLCRNTELDGAVLNGFSDYYNCKI